VRFYVVFYFPRQYLPHPVQVGRPGFVGRVFDAVDYRRVVVEVRRNPHLQLVAFFEMIVDERLQRFFGEVVAVPRLVTFVLRQYVTLRVFKFQVHERFGISVQLTHLHVVQ